MAACALRSQRRRSTALLLAILLPVLPASFLPARAQAQQDEPGSRETTTLDRISVTGSRIRRTDVEEALPITVIQKAEIEQQGISSAEQLLMYLNIAGNGSDNLASNAGIVHEDQRGNNGVSGANLRGQGADATLVLLNGRRVATHGLKGRAVDLNSIPFAAIDRVEVLRDGASAIYGTDAIGGVINFITRRDYQGAQASAFIDTTEAGGGDIYRANMLVGAGDIDVDGWNAFATFSFRKSGILRGTDRDFSNAFQPERGLSPDTRGPPFATVFGISPDSLAGEGLVDPADGSVQTGVNILNLPGGPGCEAGGEMMGPYDWRLWSVPASRYACAWDYPAAAVIQQPQESADLLARASFRLGEGHEAYVEFTGSQVDVDKRFEANQLSSSTSETAALNPSTWYPSTGEAYDAVYQALADYFGADQLNYGAPIAYRWRCMPCGPREIRTRTRSFRVLAGLQGRLGNWDYDVGLSRAASNSQSTLGGGFHFTDALQEVLGSGLLNPFLLPGQSQSPEAMAALEAASARGVVLYDGTSILTQLDASVSGGVGLSLPGGEIQLATGIDLRREEFRFGAGEGPDRRPVFNAPFDDSNVLEDVRRDIKAVYAEAYLPLLDSLELVLATRYDRYDGFGSTTNPKVSFKYQPVDWLLFRGAYSTGFKVPSFNQLFNGVSEQPYTGFDLADPETCPGGVADPEVPGCEAIQPVQLFGGKEDLEPEESKQKSFGVVFAPNERFNLSLDWWEIERENTIQIAQQDVLVEFYDVFRDNWIRDANGELVAIDRRYINSGGSLTRGVELDANLTGDLGPGRWHVNLSGSYIDAFRTKALETLPYSDNLVGEYVRYYNLPIRWKHTLNLGYEHGHWFHSLSQIYRGGYDDELPVSVANETYTPPAWDPKVDSYITYNYSLTYTGFERMKLAFGIKNLLDEDPPFTAHHNDFGAGAAWEARVGDPRGRAYTFMVEYKFF